MKMEPIDRLFIVFYVYRTKNEEVTRFTPLELKINRHMKKINAVVIDLNIMDIFFEYN